MEAMGLKEFLSWLMEFGASYLGFWIVEKVTETGPASAWSVLEKRIAAYGTTGLIAILAFLASIAMQFQPLPGDWRAWVQALFVVATSAFGLATLMHGLKAKNRQPQAVRYTPEE
jgi:hypothetical protein